MKNSRLQQDLPISINDRVILPFREGSIFTKLRVCEVLRKIKSSRKFPNLQELDCMDAYAGLLHVRIQQY